MPFVPNFVCTQPLGDSSVITIEDTSSGSDGTLTGRRVYLRTDANTFLVPEGNSTEYIEWDINDATIQIDVLLKDWAIDVVVQWMAGAVDIPYDKTILNGFTSYNEEFDLGLSSLLASNYKLFSDNDYFLNKSKLRDAIDSGDKAVTRGSDISKAQACYDVGTAIRLKSRYNFNANS